jgi:hypothetical protein
MFNSIIYSVFILFSCQKEKSSEAPKPLKINKIFSEDTHDDTAMVYTNDSLFCIYSDDHHLKVWKNGLLLKESKEILPLIKKMSQPKCSELINFSQNL